MNDTLKKLLEAAKTAKPTPEHREQQRRSVVYGNAAFENDLITREMVDREADKRERRMSESGTEKRDSRALEPVLITDPHLKAEAETRNGLRQYDAGIDRVRTALQRGFFKLRPSLILGLQREALAGISLFAGNYRPAGVAIEGSKHEPAAGKSVGRVLSGGRREVSWRLNSDGTRVLSASLRTGVGG